MRFFHTGVYPQRYRALIGAAGADHALEPFVVVCPGCGVLYVADPGEDDGLGLEDEAYVATSWLLRECPDHAHVFLVAP